MWWFLAYRRSGQRIILDKAVGYDLRFTGAVAANNRFCSVMVSTFGVSRKVGVRLPPEALTNVANASWDYI